MISLRAETPGERPSESSAEACPDCGAPMQVLYCLREHASLFVWFECAEMTCGGHLLRKYPATAPVQA